MVFDRLIFNLLNLGAFASVFILAISVCKKLYGGKLASSLPYLLAGVFLFFGMVVFDTLFLVFGPDDLSLHALQTSSQVIAILAVAFLLHACYKIYLLQYATSGYMDGDVHE